MCGLVERLTGVRKRGTLCRRRGSLSHEECDRVKRLVQFLICGSVVSFVLFAVVGASGSGAKSAVTIPDFSVSQLLAPGGADWITTNGNIKAQRYSSLNQINTSNGSGLKLAWTTHLANPATTDPLGAGNQQPLVYNGVLYTQDGWGRVTAMDATSGKIEWQFHPPIPPNGPGGDDSVPTARPRGVAGWRDLPRVAGAAGWRDRTPG